MGIHLSHWVTVVCVSLSDMGIALPATSTFIFYVLDEFKLSDMGICLLSTLGQDCIFMGFYDFNDAIAANFLKCLCCIPTLRVVDVNRTSTLPW